MPRRKRRPKHPQRVIHHPQEEEDVMGPIFLELYCITDDTCDTFLVMYLIEKNYLHMSYSKAKVMYGLPWDNFWFPHTLPSCPDVRWFLCLWGAAGNSTKRLGNAEVDAESLKKDGTKKPKKLFVDCSGTMWCNRCISKTSYLFQEPNGRLHWDFHSFQNSLLVTCWK